MSSLVNNPLVDILLVPVDPIDELFDGDRLVLVVPLVVIAALIPLVVIVPVDVVTLVVIVTLVPVVPLVVIVPVDVVTLDTLALVVTLVVIVPVDVLVSLVDGSTLVAGSTLNTKLLSSILADLRTTSLLRANESFKLAIRLLKLCVEPLVPKTAFILPSYRLIDRSRTSPCLTNIQL